METNADKVSVIVLHRGAKGLGFTIGGGIDKPHIPGDNGLFVTNIREGAAKDAGRLNEGDKILSVNGKRLVDITQEEAVQCFTRIQSNLPVTIEVQHGAEAFIKQRLSEANENKDANELDKQLSHDEEKKYNCNVCEEDGKQILAQGYCEVCSECFCEPCVMYHKRLKATKDHIMHDIDYVKRASMGNDEVRDLNSVGESKTFTKICENHAEELIRFYCWTCDVAVCAICMCTRHRACDKVDFIGDIAKSWAESDECTQMKQTLGSLTDRLHSADIKFQTNLSSVEELSQNAKAAIRKQRDAIDNFFDKIEKSITAKIENIKCEDTSKMENLKTECSAIRSKVTGLVTDVEKKEKLHQLCQLFVLVKTLKTTVENLESNMDKVEVENTIKRYNFQPSTFISEMLDEKEMGFLDTALTDQSQFDKGSCEDTETK